MPFGFIKTEINMPQEYVTAVDIGYPVDLPQVSLYLLL
jgi:hypothetical protein